MLITEFLIKNFPDLSKKVVREFLVEKKLEDPELEEMRRGVCSTCPKRTVLDTKKGPEPVCGSCGCMIEEKVASEFDYSINYLTIVPTHCPDGLWPVRHEGGFKTDLELANYYRNKYGHPIITN